MSPRPDVDAMIAVVAATPLVSIDLVVRDDEGRMLAGWRVNEPARDTWFVPGGRILKDETVAAAMRRISHAELGVALTLDEVRFLGVFDHIYDTNFACVPGIGTHYVCLAYEVLVPVAWSALPADQHARWTWLAPGTTQRDVHPNTLAYFTALGPPR